MALLDFQTFIRERMSVYNSDLDTSDGSPFDTRVMQPLLRRIGTDPFTQDTASFLLERLSQEFPDLAASDGDAISDGLVKPALVIWDPIIREVKRVILMLSMRDPTQLTLDEADALGANLFAERDKGKYSRGIGRIYFAQAQKCTVNQLNFFSTRSNLHFFPTKVQSISFSEMLLNKEGELYYFDVNAVAEGPGSSYNIDPGELVSIANIAAAVRVRNLARFRDGLPAEDAVTFIARAQQELTERSLVTGRGIAAQVPKAFPEISRLAIVGTSDIEMRRDVLTGGGLGEIRASGLDATSQGDGTLRLFTRRVSFPSVNLFDLVGPAGPVPPGYVLTLVDAYGTGTPKIRDFGVTRVIDQTTCEVDRQEIALGQTGKAWTLRKLELTLSHIPGGILFPNTAEGTLVLPDGQVHVGGCVDTLVRGSELDAGTLLLDVASDDNPLRHGSDLDIVGGAPYVALTTEVLGTTYEEGDALYQDLDDAKALQYSFEILDGPAAGVYRVIDLLQFPGSSPLLLLSPPPLAAAGLYRWRLLDVLDIDLVEPKETRIKGSDGQTTQNVDVFTTAGGVNFSALGTSPGDILRVLSGPDKGDFIVSRVLTPFYTQLSLDRPFSASTAGVSYLLFRANSGGGITRPLLRITGIDLLDTTGQPVGSKVPYALPVEIVSASFANVGRGVKLAANDVMLGMVSVLFGSGLAFSAGSLLLTWDGATLPLTLSFSGTMSASSRAASLNSQSQTAFGFDVCAVIPDGSNSRLGFLPARPGLRVDPASTPSVLTTLFGDASLRSVRSVRSGSVADWTTLSPGIDVETDVLEVLTGVQPGYYAGLVLSPGVLLTSQDFYPEIHRAIRIGARSLGSARAYFLEPTSAEVDGRSHFLATAPTGVPVRYLPDPALRAQKVPPLPGGSKPLDGQVSGNVFIGPGKDFVKIGIRPGDLLILDYQPLQGGATLADPVPGLALKQLVVSLSNGPDQVITFVNDVSTPGAVSRKGAAAQVNAAVGLQISSILDAGGGDFRLTFNPDADLVVRQNTGPQSASSLLGLASAGDVNNRSPSAGTYEVSDVGPSDPSHLAIFPAAPVALTAQQYTVVRPGSQRISTTQMAGQITSEGFYYWDIELVSEGSGDEWNIGSGAEMTVTGLRSDGYWLTSQDLHTTFSPAEQLTLHLSRSILEAGVDDDPNNATQLSGQALSISYQFSSLVSQVQDFSMSESERVVCASPLARHLVPHFVRFSVTYAGGSKEAEILPDIETYINDLLPSDALESSDIQKLILNRGATGISNPLNLLAVVYNFDRTVTLARSQDALTTGRLSSFFPDLITLRRTPG